MNTHKLTRVAYWFSTGIVVPGLLLGGLRFVVGVPDAVATFAHLGFPAYLIPMLGISKMLAALVILAPRTPRLKEWVYAGVTFDLGGAAVSHLLVGDPVGVLIGPLATLGLALISWASRPRDRKLGDVTGGQKERRGGDLVEMNGIEPSAS